jgi:hypothetical protein
MGLEGYRLWVMGQLDSTCRALPHVVHAHHLAVVVQVADPPRRRLPLRRSLRVVALQVAFERQTLKPVFHLIGYRLWV